MDGHEVNMNGQRSVVYRTGFDDNMPLGPGAEFGGRDSDLHRLDIPYDVMGPPQQANGLWPRDSDDNMHMRDLGLSPRNLPPGMDDMQGAQAPFIGPTPLTGVLTPDFRSSVPSGEATYPFARQEQSPDTAMWQQELLAYQEQHGEHMQLQDWNAPQRTQSDPQWLMQMPQYDPYSLPVRPRSDPAPLIPYHAATTNFEAAQYHQQQPAGPFRSYGGQHVAVAHPPPQQHHHRQDSNASNNGAAAKVAIPKNGSVPVKREDSNPGSPQNIANASMTAIRSGPMSREVQVQPRPRPGRKPMAGEDKEDRRRLQNRMAQRAFRDKRAQKNVELEVEINRLKAEYQQHEADYRNTIAELRTSCQEKDRQNAELSTINTSLEARVAKHEQRVAELERQLKLANSNVGSFRDATGQPADQRPASVPTPPESNYEIDFTNYGRTTGTTYGLRNTLSNDSNAMDFSVDTEDPCGFCTDDQNCACKQEQQQRQRPKPTPIEPRVSATLPGSCDMCQSDPERARACREMAAATRPAVNATPRTSASFGSRPSLTSTTMPPPRMSCSAMVDEFNKFGERTSSIGGLFGGRRLNAYPRETGGGFDLEEAQAAEVLSTLHRRSEGATSTSSFADSQSGQASTTM